MDMEGLYGWLKRKWKKTEKLTAPVDWKSEKGSCGESPIIYREKEKPIRLTVGFKILLGFAIFLSGVMVLAYFPVFTSLPGTDVFSDMELTVRYYRKMLYCIILCLCFLMLISIAISKRPFNCALYRLGIAVGVLMFVSSFLFPRINGYYTNFEILANGRHCMFDGNYLFPGLFILVFALLMRYGYKYQNNSDMTV